MEQQLLNMRELSEKLKISKPMIRKMVSDGEIPVFKVGSHLRFYWPAVEDVLRGKTLNEVSE